MKIKYKLKAEYESVKLLERVLGWMKEVAQSDFKSDTSDIPTSRITLVLMPENIQDLDLMLAGLKKAEKFLKKI